MRKANFIYLEILKKIPFTSFSTGIKIKTQNLNRGFNRFFKNLFQARQKASKYTIFYIMF